MDPEKNIFEKPKEPKEIELPEEYLGDYEEEYGEIYGGPDPELGIVLEPFLDKDPEASNLFKKLEDVKIDDESREKLFKKFEEWKEKLEENKDDLTEIGRIALEKLRDVLSGDQPDW